MEVVLKVMVQNKDYMFWDRLIRVCLVLMMTCMLYLGMRNYDYANGMMAEPKGSVWSPMPEGRITRIDAGGIDAYGGKLKKNLLSRSMLDDKIGMVVSLAVMSREKNVSDMSASVKSDTIDPGTLKEADKVMKVTETTKITAILDYPYKTVPKTEEENTVTVIAPTVPDVGDEEETDLKRNENIGAGVREFSGFVVDNEGYITGVTDKVDITDGILVIPTDVECVGIRKGAFNSLSGDIIEMYIPVNILAIETDVFDDLPYLIYIEVAGDNQCYYSEGGVLYSESGEEFFCPIGR